MNDTPAFPHLFAPPDVGRRRLRNRICLPATVTNFARDNLITPRWQNFLIERARGGAALLVSEIIAVDAQAVAQASTVVGFDDRNERGFHETAARVEAEGGLLLGQLWHPGRQQLWQPSSAPAGVNDDPDPYSWTVAHAMDDGEIEALIEAYVETARRLQRFGLAGVELHGAHGYLIHQFLSPWSNTRRDRWGGDRHGRTRFAAAIADGIRESCGRDFLIGLKMPGTELTEGGIDVEEAAALTAHLAIPGRFDYLAYGQGNFSLSLESHVPDLYFRPGHFLDVHARMRQAACGVPVMALGRIGTPDLAERAVQTGQADLIGMSRAQISDAAFAAKAGSGRAAEIRPCVFDNACWGEVHRGRPIAEPHNPRLGEAGEADWQPAPSDSPRHIAVVGAGPAGLEAAWVAAARGHRVTLFGAGDAVGGGLLRESRLPGRAELAQIVNHQRRLIERYGVRCHLGRAADSTTLAESAPDLILLAGGAALREPSWAGALSLPSIDGRGYVEHGPPAGRRQRVVLFDQDQSAATYGLADLLACDFEDLVLVTPRPHFAQNVNHCSAIGIYRRLYRAGVKLVPAHRPISGNGEDLVLENVYGGPPQTLHEVDLLVYVTPRRVRPCDLPPGIPVHAIGDARSPRDLTAALHGAHHLACAL